MEEARLKRIFKKRILLYIEYNEAKRGIRKSCEETNPEPKSKEL